MSYCGICDNHNVTFTKVDGGWYCSGCGGILYNDDLEIENLKRTLSGAILGKREGWKIYPNWEEFGEPIDDVIAECERKLKEKGEAF